MPMVLITNLFFMMKKFLAISLSILSFALEGEAYAQSKTVRSILTERIKDIKAFPLLISGGETLSLEISGDGVFVESTKTIDAYYAVHIQDLRSYLSVEAIINGLGDESSLVRYLSWLMLRAEQQRDFASHPYAPTSSPNDPYNVRMRKIYVEINKRSPRKNSN